MNLIFLIKMEAEFYDLVNQLHVVFDLKHMIMEKLQKDYLFEKL